MDIYSKFLGAAGALSNFSVFPFVIDEVACVSMEGFLQSLLVEDPDAQTAICRLAGPKAKAWGTVRLEFLGETKWLWWRGIRYDRFSAEYGALLDRAYEALSRNDDFRAVLLSTGEEELTHSIARGEGPDKTILTEEEFCSRLMKLRAWLRSAS